MAAQSEVFLSWLGSRVRKEKSQNDSRGRSVRVLTLINLVAEVATRLDQRLQALEEAATPNANINVSGVHLAATEDIIQYWAGRLTPETARPLALIQSARRNMLEDARERGVIRDWAETNAFDAAMALLITEAFLRGEQEGTEKGALRSETQR